MVILTDNSLRGNSKVVMGRFVFLLLIFFLFSNQFNVFAQNGMGMGGGIFGSSLGNQVDITSYEYLSDPKNQRLIVQSFSSMIPSQIYNSFDHDHKRYQTNIDNFLKQYGLDKSYNYELRQQILKKVAYELAKPAVAIDPDAEFRDGVAVMRVTNVQKTDRLDIFKNYAKELKLDLPENYDQARKMSEIYEKGYKDQAEFFKEIKANLSNEEQLIAIQDGMLAFHESKNYLAESVKYMVANNNIDKEMLQNMLTWQLMSEVNDPQSSVPGLTELLLKYVGIDDPVFSMYVNSASIICSNIIFFKNSKEMKPMIEEAELSNDELERERKFNEKYENNFVKQVERLYELGSNLGQICENGEDPRSMLTELERDGHINLSNSSLKSALNIENQPCMVIDGNIDLASLCLNLEVVNILENDIRRKNNTMKEVKSGSSIEFVDSRGVNDKCTITTLENMINKNGIVKSNRIEFTITSKISNEELKLTFKDQESFRREINNLIDKK